MKRKIVGIAFFTVSLWFGLVTRVCEGEEIDREAVKAPLARGLHLPNSPKFAHEGKVKPCRGTLDASLELCPVSQPFTGLAMVQWLMARAFPMADKPPGSPSAIRITPTMAAGGYGVMVAGSF
ncbi:MAG TPA: hypothetical protein VIV60_07570 [Polyangiaceae bacterium]